jgi:hypothetical protein
MEQGVRRMVPGKLLEHCCTRSTASVAQSAARRLTAGARRSLHVTRCRRSAGRSPGLQGAGLQADGGRQATRASLHMIRRQRCAERGPRTLMVKRSWRSAGRAPGLHGAGRQADGGRQATIASLYTIHRQRSAERGLPHDGGRNAVTECDAPLAKRWAHALPAWGRASGGWWQVSYYSIAAHDPPPVERGARPVP